MKKYFFCLISLCTLLHASPIQDHRIDPKALSELAHVLGIAPDADIISETQKSWLRKSGQERWEMHEISAEQRQFVLNWAKEQGLYAAWKPLYKQYDKALILGATTSRMQLRLDYLKQLWEEGIRFHEIVWLTGDRPLDPRVDGLITRCDNESQAARILWEEAHLPNEMRALRSTFIAVPMKKEGASYHRPQTADTIIAWLDVSSEPCTALFVSDQPFCGYQYAVIKSMLPEAFQFDLVGQGVDPDIHPAAAAITLDSIARWIFQESMH